MLTIKSLVEAYCCPFINPQWATIDYQDRRRPMEIRYLEAITLVYDGLENWHIISRTGERPAAPGPRAADD